MLFGKVWQMLAGHPRSRLWPAVAFCTALGGCALNGAPSYSLFGAYFPLWMFCAVVGVIGAMLTRFLFVATGLANVIPFQLFVCTAIGLLIGLAVWRLCLGPLA